ncbi:MAG: 30S ribosomal protein S6--L-glutamate ligase [Pseudomonadota bacterium]
MAKTTKPMPLALGWEEWLNLPGLKIPAIKAKIDTGATTSSLHALYVEPYMSKSGKRVHFIVKPTPDKPDLILHCSAKVIDEREVTSSNGDTELRYVIETLIDIGGQKWPIEMTLSNREGMQYRMLLGRSALPENSIVNPAKSCIHGIPPLSIYDQHEKKDREFKPLRIGILSESKNIYSTKRLLETARARGHEAELVRTSQCYMNIAYEGAAVHHFDRSYERYDAIIPRIASSLTFFGTAVVRQFETMGTYCINRAQAINASRDKLYAHQIMAQNKLPMPKTAFTKSSEHTEEVIDLVGNAPLVIKLLDSTQGNGVVLAETQQAAESVIGAFQGLRANILVQEYIEEAKGTDIRCFVVGRKVVAAMKRTAREGEFRSNIHRGGKGAKIKITPEERKIAVRAARALGLNVAGVDIIRAGDGPKILEVNSSPGLEGVEKSTGVDVASKIIDYIEQNARTVLAHNRKKV